MTGHVFIAAVESSSDQLGAGLIAALREQSPDIQISAVGGPAMAEEGVETLVDIAGLSILGFTEAIKAYPLVLRRVRETVDAIMSAAPDAAILIDSWGFMIRVSQGLKRAGFKGQIIKYVAPQVWAMREGRAKLLAKSTDNVLSIHSFDGPYFEKHGLPVTYVGNPMFDIDYRTGDGEGFKRGWHIPKDKLVIGLLLGSRESEITRLAPTLAKAAVLLEKKYNARIVSPIVAASESALNAAAHDHPEIIRIQRVPQSELIDAMAAMDVAIACSGTVTTQLASAGVPTIVAYKLAPLTFFAAKRLFKPDYISIVNIAAGSALMPEFIQDDATPQAIADAAEAFLGNSVARERRSKELIAQTDEMMGEGGSASESAARIIIELIGA